jgi:two-component system sensor histidine kinase DegS
MAWLAEMEADASRLRELTRDAVMMLGPSLPIQEMQTTADRLRRRIAAGRSLTPAGAPAEAPTGEPDPPAVRAMLDREDQSRRLAVALESSLGQLLANAVVELTYSEPLMESDPAAVRAGILQLKDELQEGLERLRWIVADVRAPSLLSEMGLGPSLTRYAGRFAAHAHVEVRTPTLEKFAERLPATLELAVFRIVQEALRNVERHASASYVEVGVTAAPAGWLFYVEDDGRGFETALPANSLGLMDMQARGRAVGGQVQVVGRAGGGARVTFLAPALPGSSQVADPEVRR